MEDINRIRKISIWIFFLPAVALNLCLFISVNAEYLNHTVFAVEDIGRIGFTIPYIDGNVSISRTARTYPTYLLFKPGMVITALLLIQYWIANNKLFKELNNELKNKFFFIFGVGSAIFLVLHSIFLGVSFDLDSFALLEKIDKFLRRFVLLGFILFEIIAQSLLVINIIKIKEKISSFINKKVLILKIILVSILVIVAILSAPILNSDNYTHFKHALEWNYFLGVVTFYLLTFLFWKRA